MPEIFPFDPNPNGPFRFSPTLDGAPHQAEVIWSIFGQRWHMRLFDPAGEVVLLRAVVGSKEFAATDSLAWDQLRQRVYLTSLDPHGYKIGTVVSITVRGARPDAFNGDFQAVAESARVLSYPMRADPGALVTPGYFGHEANLAAGYFNSKLVYRESAKRFEVW